MRKLYYAPGIISLIGIWAFYFYFQKRFIVKKQVCLSFVVPTDRNYNTPTFSTNYMQNWIAKKKQLRIELTGDREINQKKIELIRYEARKLKYTMDTTTVINIALTKEVKYSELIQLIDMCYIDKHRRFTLIKNSFLIFGEYPPEVRDTTKETHLIYL